MLKGLAMQKRLTMLKRIPMLEILPILEGLTRLKVRSKTCNFLILISPPQCEITVRVLLKQQAYRLNLGQRKFSWTRN